MASIAENLQLVRERIARGCHDARRPAQSVTLLAVSKTFGATQVREAFAAGQRDFGENYVQEALANIAKHSMARHAVVAINKSVDGLEFLIKDDGLGMDEPSVSTIVTTAKGLGSKAHFGLEIMQARAKRLGGSLEVSRNEGGGTSVRLLMPLREMAEGSLS